MTDKLPVSKDEWNEYKAIQMDGEFNMFDPRAREMSTLNQSQWLYIISNYDELSLIYEGENE